MKLWFLAFGVVIVAAWILVTPMRSKVMPEVLRGGNEQILAQWRDALLAYKAELGTFPSTHEYSTREESIVNALNKGNTALNEEKKPGKEFIDLSTVRLESISPVDAWGFNLIFDPERTGDLSNVLSVGPDGQMGTEDDMSSLNARQRNIPVPVELLDERILSKRAAKAAADDSASDAAAGGGEGKDDGSDKGKTKGGKPKASPGAGKGTEKSASEPAETKKD